MKQRLMIGLAAGALVAAMLPGAVAAAGSSAAWTRQFGSAGYDSAYRVAVDRKGNQYVAGYTGGSLPGQTSKGSGDVFLRKVRPNGTTAWTRQFGTSANESATDVAVDRTGRIYVAGWTKGAFPGQASQGDTHAFVRKFRPNGTTVWTRQFGTGGYDSSDAVAVDGSGRVYIVGRTSGILAGKTNRGGWDAFIRKLRPDGSTLWTRQFGTIENERADAVAVDGTGRIVVAGETGGTLPGQTSQGGRDAYVRKLRPDGKTTWTRQFGTSATDWAVGVAADGAGRVHVVGATSGTLPGQTSPGGVDAFLRKLRPDGRTTWTRQFGTGDIDYAMGVALDRSGRVYVVGYTRGTFPGEVNQGDYDAFIRKVRPNGGASWTRHFGTVDLDWANGITVDRLGRAYVVGETKGTLGKASLGDYDAYIRKYR